MRKNVHLNFKTEKEIFDYFQECAHIQIKKPVHANSGEIERNVFIFKDLVFLSFCLTLALIVSVGVFLINPFLKEGKHLWQKEEVPSASSRQTPIPISTISV